MSGTEIISEIKQLPSARRRTVLRFVEELRVAETRNAWDKEAARRLGTIVLGKAKVVQTEKVFARLRAKYG